MHKFWPPLVRQAVRVVAVAGVVMVTISLGSAGASSVGGARSEPIASVDVTPPGMAHGLTSDVMSSMVGFTCSIPRDADFVGTMVRRSTGRIPPTSASDGTLVFITRATYWPMFVDDPLNAGTTYSYSFFAYDGVPNYAAPTTRTITTPPSSDTTPPPPVTGLKATNTTATTVSLKWTDPDSTDFYSVLIRRVVGTVPPANASAGTLVAHVFGAGKYTDTGLTPGTTYSYGVFAHDVVPNYSRRVCKTVTTTR